MTFSAVTGLQVEGTRVEGSVLVVELVPSTSGARFNLKDVNQPVLTRLAKLAAEQAGTDIHHCRCRHRHRRRSL